MVFLDHQCCPPAKGVCPGVKVMQHFRKGTSTNSKIQGSQCDGLGLLCFSVSHYEYTVWVRCTYAIFKMSASLVGMPVFTLQQQTVATRFLVPPIAPDLQQSASSNNPTTISPESFLVLFYFNYTEGNFCLNGSLNQNMKKRCSLACL